MASKNTALVGVCFVTSMSKKLNNERIVGHFDNESDITEKKILDYAGTLEDKTIKYLRWIRILARKATFSFVLSVCLSVSLPARAK
jgi:hypothetical protein